MKKINRSPLTFFDLKNFLASLTGKISFNFKCVHKYVVSSIETTAIFVPISVVRMRTFLKNIYIRHFPL